MRLVSEEDSDCGMRDPQAPRTAARSALRRVASEIARRRLKYCPDTSEARGNDMFLKELMLDDSRTLNAALYARFVALSGTDRVRRTHLHEGRFENTYVDPADIPDIAPVLALAKEQAGCHLGRTAAGLKAGFWFNVMGPGQRTLAHHHDENDELLSGVYYVRVPDNSGDLLLHDAQGTVTVRPREGKLVLFSPATVHEVTTNLSRELRLSVAINIGPVNRADA